MSGRPRDKELELSRLDLQILNALLVRPLSGYDIAAQYALDVGASFKVSNGSLYPALARLEAWSLIAEVKQTASVAQPGKPKKVYKITSFGREVMTWQLRDWQRLLDQARDRSRR